MPPKHKENKFHLLRAGILKLNSTAKVPPIKNFCLYRNSFSRKETTKKQSRLSSLRSHKYKTNLLDIPNV